MKKLKYLVLAAFLMVMPGVKALTGDYAKVEDITNPDTLEGNKTGVITGDESATTTLTYSEGTFKLLPAEGDRPAGYAWIGIRITVPESATNVKFDGDAVTPASDTHTFDEYYGFNPDKLEASLRDGEEARIGSFVLTYTLNDKTVTQTINFVIEPENIVIKNETSEEVWNDDIYTELMDDIAASEEEPEKDDSPKTGVVDYTLIAGIIAAASMVAYLDLKKRFN